MLLLVARFTAPSSPERHLRAAEALGVDTRDAAPEDAGEALASRVVELMQVLKMPSGLTEVGYTSDDIPKLVEGTLPQHRVTKLSPIPAGEAELTSLFENSMTIW